MSDFEIMAMERLLHALCWTHPLEVYSSTFADYDSVAGHYVLSELATSPIFPFHLVLILNLRPLALLLDFDKGVSLFNCSLILLLANLS